jgi:hypothetical protein
MHNEVVKAKLAYTHIYAIDKGGNIIYLIMIPFKNKFIKHSNKCFFLINVGVRASLRAPRLISRALKLANM